MESVFCRFNLIFLSGFVCYCVMASDWPEGYYGLQMAKSGCPDGATFKWETGWIYQDTENNYPSSSKSTSFHIEGLVRDSSVNRSFCIKNNVTNDHRRPIWPAGAYCIYQRETDCPLGFRSGSITWDDEDTNNKNRQNGSLPKVDLFNKNTKIYFCCRNDGYKSSPIDLPTSSPFFLFAHYSKSCQQVRWAVSTSEWIYYHTEDDHISGYYNSVTDPAPYVSGISGGHKIYYCYYTSCQFTLNNASAGSIQFPRSKNYANGQYCSWKISVKPSQKIQVQITYLYLNGVNDQLIFYDGTDASAPLLGTLHGKSSPSNSMKGDIQSSSSNLFIMFRSNRVHSSIGFKLSYTATDTVTSPPLTTTATLAITSTETEVLTDTPQKTDRPDFGSTSTRDPHKISTFEPSPAKKNSSKSYEMFKKTCVQQSHTALTAVAVVIPVICMIAVIAMAGYLFLRLRTLREKSSNVSVRYSPESVNNPSYVPGDAVMQARVPSESNAYENKEEGDDYHEIGHQTQATDNPLYQSTDTDKHVYASFA